MNCIEKSELVELLVTWYNRMDANAKASATAEEDAVDDLISESGEAVRDDRADDSEEDSVPITQWSSYAAAVENTDVKEVELRPEEWVVPHVKKEVHTVFYTAAA